MVLQNLSNLDDDTASKYPGITNYAACQSRAFVQGVLGMVVGGGSGALAALTARRYIPGFPSRYNIFYIAGAAIVAGYAVTARASRKCQESLVQSQLEKKMAEEQNGQGSFAGDKAASPRVTELASDTQRTTTLASEKLLPGGD